MSGILTLLLVLAAMFIVVFACVMLVVAIVIIVKTSKSPTPLASEANAGACDTEAVSKEEPLADGECEECKCECDNGACSCECTEEACECKCEAEGEPSITINNVNMNG